MSKPSVVKKADWLKSILASPQTLTTEERVSAIAACKSQGSLAKYSSDELGFGSSSLNTLKTHAESHLEHGFGGLDRLRTSAFSILTEIVAKENIPKRGTKASYIEKSKSQKEELQKLTDELQLMTAKLDDVLAYTKALAEQCNQAASYAKMRRELFSKFI